MCGRTYTGLCLESVITHAAVIFSAIAISWLDFSLPPRCPQAVWCLWGGEPFSALLAQDRLAECDQPGKNPLKYSAMPWLGILGAVFECP